MEPLSTFLSTPHGLVAAVIFGLLAGNAIFGGAQLKAHIRLDCANLANLLTKAGLTHVPKILTALSVGDLAGALHEVRSCVHTLGDPAQLKAEFEKTFTNMLNAALADPKQAAALKQLVNDGAAGAPVSQLARDAQGVAAASPLFGSLAQHGLQLAQLFPALAANPALAAVASALPAGLSHLLPLLNAAAQATVPTAANLVAPKAA